MFLQLDETELFMHIQTRKHQLSFNGVLTSLNWFAASNVRAWRKLASVFRSRSTLVTDEAKTPSSLQACWASFKQPLIEGHEKLSNVNKQTVNIHHISIDYLCRACSWMSCNFNSKILDFARERNLSSAILSAEKASVTEKTEL